MISVVIITFNESRCIQACITSLAGITTNIIVVDSGSTDGTQELAVKAGAHVIQQPWLGFGKQKNVGIAAAKYDYILSLDADEQLDETLRTSILTEMKKGLKNVYSIRFRHNYYGNFIDYGIENPQWKIRLFNRNEFIWDEKEVHESLNIPVGYIVQKLPGRILHYGYVNQQHHAIKTENYATLGAIQLFKKGKKNYWWKIIVSPAFTFLQAYIFKLGFLDGATGFKLAKWNAYTTYLKYKKARDLFNNKAD